jgi:phosphatidylcholine synthase
VAKRFGKERIFHGSACARHELLGSLANGEWIGQSIPRDGRSGDGMKNADVWAVHLLTASGAAIALAAAIAAADQKWRLVFLLLGVAMLLDGIDGPLARKLDVKDRIPWFDGSTLDLVVDYSTYVLIPAFVLAQGGILSKPYAIVSAIVVAVVGALYFADTRMKTTEQAFRGFPAVWNAVVFQLMVFKFPEPVTLIIIAAFAVLSFAPVEFVHPVRVKRWRPLTLTMAVAWGLLALVALINNLDPGPVVVFAFAVVSFYFAVVGVLLQLTRPAATPLTEQ